VLAARRGATALEFSLVAGPFLLLVFMILEVGWQLAGAAALDHAALRASRFGVTGGANPVQVAGAPTCRSDAIPWMVTYATGGFLRPEHLTLTMHSYGNYASAASGTGGAVGPGGAGEIVVYRLRYRQHFLVESLAQFALGTPWVTHSADIVVKNEPFPDAAQC
jgi:hypothetical protein